MFFFMIFMNLKEKKVNMDLVKMTEDLIKLDISLWSKLLRY